MKISIKYMVSDRCKSAVKKILKNLGLHFIIVDLGDVEIMEFLTSQQTERMRSALSQEGFELMEDKKSILIERIKSLIIEVVNQSEEIKKIKFSDYLSENLGHDYISLSNLFSEVQGTTIEQFVIFNKIEKIKELIIYGELSLTEISWKMNYSSVAHLSNQFKKVTGLTPSHFRQLKAKRQQPGKEKKNMQVAY